MAKIKPFRGMRYSESAGDISKLCCPPYDIISEEQRLKYIAENEHNIVRLELPKQGDNPYKKAYDILNEWRENGVLITEECTLKGVGVFLKGDDYLYVEVEDENN